MLSIFKNKRGQVVETGIGFGFIIAVGIVLFILLPIGIGGFATVFKLIGFMYTPILGNSIPLWVVFLAVLMLLMFLRRSGRSVQLVQAR